MINRIVSTNAFSLLMTLWTFYSLFAADFRMAYTAKTFDTSADTLTTLCLIFFLMEMIMVSIVDESYFLSFYFWLDFVSTVSLITDISYLWWGLVGDGDVTTNNALQLSTAAKASQSGRAGARAMRITRIVRFIRLSRVVKLYHSAELANASSDETQ